MKINSSFCRFQKKESRKNRTVLRCESLEERALLAVMSGGPESYAEYAQYEQSEPQTAAPILPAGAVEWVVNSLEDSSTWSTADSKLTLREAVSRAAAGDTITFDASLSGGTITLCGTELTISKNLTIDASDAGGIIIDANGDSRCFNITAGSGKTVQLTGLTLTQGYTESNGGGIYNGAGALNLTDITILYNSAEGNGGGLYNNSGTVTVMNSIIQENWGNYGGGIDSNSGTITVTNTLIAGNGGITAGGGFYQYSGTAAFTNCTVTMNVTDGKGGGIAFAGKLYLYNSIVSQNTAITSGEDISRTSGSSYGYYTLTSFTGWTVKNSIFTYDEAQPLFADTGFGDYSLAKNSQAIDIGSNSYVKTDYDLAGDDRIQNGIVDLGAYEYRKVKEEPSTVVTTSLDIVDETDNLISLREAVNYAEAGETVTFDKSLAGAEFALSGTPIVISKAVTIDASAVGGITLNAYASSLSESAVISVTGGTSARPVELKKLTITGGYTSDNGGGIINSGYLTITDSVIFGNSGKNGGGIYNSGTLTLSGSKFYWNSASANGGGIFNVSGTVTAANSLFYQNSADGNGGAFYSTGTLNLTNVTVVSNYADTNGGGIFSTGKVYLYNSIAVLNNNAETGNDIYKTAGSVNAFYTLSSFTGWTSSTSPYVYDETLPLFTDESIGDYTLADQSQGIDVGCNDYVTAETDLAGNLRIQNGIVDLGAYESPEKQKEEPSTIVTTALDIVDDTDHLISLREAIDYAQPGDTVTFHSSLSGVTFFLAETPLSIDKAITIDASESGGATIDADGLSACFVITGGSEEVPVKLTALTITGGKTAGSGGGINNTGSLFLTNCSLSKNNAAAGGGIYNTGTLILSQSEIFWNTAVSGGGIENEGGTVTISHTFIYENTAEGDGGACRNSGGVLTVSNSQITSNAANSGGGIYNTGTADLTNVTLSSNSAQTGGGGIYNTGTITLYNSLSVLNTLSGEENDITAAAGAVNAYYSLSSYTGWTDSESVLVYDKTQPLFKDVLSGDYTLADWSQAIRAGNNDYVDSETDLAGNPRILRDIVDLGAYEHTGQEWEPEQLTAPEITTGRSGIFVSYGANRHQVVWSAVENASGYELQWTADGETWTSLSASESSAVIQGLTYEAEITYRVRAVGDGDFFLDSDWSKEKSFTVCPVDINGDSDISGADRVIMGECWHTEEGDEEYLPAGDIDGDGDIGGSDFSFLSANWNKEVGEDEITYPRPIAEELGERDVFFESSEDWFDMFLF